MEDPQDIRDQAEADFENALRTARALRDEAMQMVWETYDENVTAARETYRKTLRQTKKGVTA